MTAAEPMHVTGTVTFVGRGDLHRIVLDGHGHEVLARRRGRMVKRDIRCNAGDRVMVELTPYDLRRGRIMWLGTDHTKVARVAHPAHV